MSTTIKLTLAGLALVSACAGAQEQEGMVVVRDAQSGQLRNATPAEVKALRAQDPAQRALVAEPPSPVLIRKDGRLQKRLGERSLVYSVATRDDAGKLGMECVQGAQAADAALKQPEHRHEDR